MDIKNYIHEFGGVTKFAQAIGVTPQVVTNWLSRGFPVEKCPTIERATHGQVRCEDLRPDVDWAVLRNSDCPAQEAA